MTQTHQEVVKVWIAPGCIVCDACETDCPEVFDVQEETCIIKPDAQKQDFTKPLTPSIIEAAEGCPVDVIKFETIEVQGPEPWADREAEQASQGQAGTSASGGAAKKGGWTPPQGPPDPHWAGLLRTAHADNPRHPRTPASINTDTARVPAEAIAAAIGPDAPPDAQEAAMVGAGFVQPGPTLADRVRQRAGTVLATAHLTRRQFSTTLAIAWGAMIATFATAGAAFQSFLVPKVTNEPPTKFKAGRLSDYVEPGVYTQYKGTQGVWIVHLPKGQLVAISTICTHLGCIPNWLSADDKFKCPCHGSGFYMDGVNFEGPAPRPLERYKINLEGDTLIVDKAVKFRQELGQWSLPGSSITI